MSRYPHLDYYINTDITPGGEIRVRAVFVHGDPEKELELEKPIERKLMTATRDTLQAARNQVKELARAKLAELQAL